MAATDLAQPVRAQPTGGHAIRVVACLLVLVAGLGLVRLVALPTYRIETASMAPSLQAGDRVLVNKLAYRLGPVRRGDVIAFEDMERPGEVAIKRVVALPGDTIAIEAGRLFVNDRRRPEAYLAGGVERTGYFGPTVVPDGHFFVLGDNRSRSVDSRFTGPVPEGLLLGRVSLRVWPPGRAGIL